MTYNEHKPIPLKRTAGVGKKLSHHQCGMLAVDYVSFKMSQKDLAEKYGICTATVSAYITLIFFQKPHKELTLQSKLNGN